MSEPPRWSIRPFDPGTDAAALAAIDTSFVTDRVFEVVPDAPRVGVAAAESGDAGDAGDGLRLRTTALAAPVTKRYEIGAADGRGDFAAVAVEGGRVVGFVEAGLEAWNRRLVIRHLYVDRAHRRRGIGRALVMRAVSHGESVLAVTAWAETSHLNVPGVAAYRRLGFSLCGFDLSLYRGTACRDEFAVFLSRPLNGGGPAGPSG